MHSRIREHPLSIAHLTTFGIVLMGLSRPLEAQGVAPSERVRIIRLNAYPPLIGTTIRSTPDTLWLIQAGQAQPTAVPLGAGIRLERSLGRHSHTLAGALVGAGVGAALTLFFLSGFCGGDTLCDGDEQVRAAAVFGLPSIALGAGIGAMIRTERWEPISSGVPSRTPTLQLGLRVAWHD